MRKQITSNSVLLAFCFPMLKEKRSNLRSEFEGAESGLTPFEASSLSSGTYSQIPCGGEI